MKERPILFSAPMVRSILEGRKTQTRRAVKPEPRYEDGQWVRRTKTRTSALRDNHGPWKLIEDDCTYGVPGDRLWVRETWAQVWDCPALPCCESSESFDENHRRVAYRSTEPDALNDYACSFDCDHDEPGCAPWKPSIHMPRWASRITLEVTGVRVERLHDISEFDAMSEGIEGTEAPNGDSVWRDYVYGQEFDNSEWFCDPRRSFFSLWTTINGLESHKANPWVWVIEFKRLAAKSEAA